MGEYSLDGVKFKTLKYSLDGMTFTPLSEETVYSLRIPTTYEYYILTKSKN